MLYVCMYLFTLKLIMITPLLKLSDKYPPPGEGTEGLQISTPRVRGLKNRIHTPGE